MSMFRNTAFLAAIMLGTLAVGCSSSEDPAPAAESEATQPLEQPAQVNATVMTSDATAAPAGLSTLSAQTTVTETVSGDAAPAGVRVFAVVPGSSKASYAAQEEFFAGAVARLGVALGDNTAIGTTQALSGQLELAGAPGAAPESVGGELIADISQLQSDSQGRDRRIREDWLQSQLYPQAKLVPTGVQGFPATYTEGEPVTFQLLGDLTVRDITVPVVFDVTATMEGGTITGTATATSTMSEFGFDPPNMMDMFTVSDEFQIQLEFTMQEQA